DVFPSVVVVVEESDSKPKKGHTDGGETRGTAEIVEGPVAVVVIEVVRVVGKICYHQVQPAVVVVIAKIHTHAGLLASVSAEGDSGGHAHFGESPIPVVVVEKTGGRIVGHVEVQLAVVIVVSEGTARAPSPGVANSGRRSHIAERAVAVVVVEDAATYMGDVDVFPAVTVVVADAHTHAPSAMVQARLCRNIGEGAVAVIVIELAGRTSAAPQI